MAAQRAGLRAAFKSPAREGRDTRRLQRVGRQRHAEMLLECLRELDPDDENPLKVGDILQIGPRPIRRKKERDEAIRVLSELGWIQVVKWKNLRIIFVPPPDR